MDMVVAEANRRAASANRRATRCPMNSVSRSALLTRTFAQLQHVIRLRFAEERQQHRQFGRIALQHCRWVARSAAAAPCAARCRAAPAPLSLTVKGVSVPSSCRRFLWVCGRRSVPCIQCSNCRLPSSHAAKMARMLLCCLQTTFWSDSTGVQGVFPCIIRLSNSNPLTVVLLVV